jgi:hypothetical protein
MAAKLKLIPGSTIRWGARRFVVVDYVGLDAVIAREVGKRNLNASRCGSPTQIGPLATGRRGLPSRLHTGRDLGGSCEAIQEPQALAGNGSH